MKLNIQILYSQGLIGWNTCIYLDVIHEQTHKDSPLLKHSETALHHCMHQQRILSSPRMAMYYIYYYI